MFWTFFFVFQKIWVFGIIGPPYCGIGATIRIGQEILCLPYAGFCNSDLIGEYLVNIYGPKNYIIISNMFDIHHRVHI